MQIKEIKAKSILVKSNLPATDYVINPYVGCPHSCIYCYASFMKKFTNHEEKWGEFVDIKINGIELIPKKDLSNKRVLISSVTDPYNEFEEKYKLTRRIIEKLVNLNPELNILTKSKLITRDIDLFKKFKNCLVSISFSSHDEKIQKILEPKASSPKEKINALAELKNNNIYAVVFISPIIPEITDWKEIINQTKDFVDEYWFENLSLKPYIINNINKFLLKHSPDLIKKFKSFYSDNIYWDKVEKEIKDYCTFKKLKFKIFFHHGK
jgi:DNA repair photolyase